MTQYSIEELIEIGRNKLLKSGNQTSRSDTISIIGKVLKKTNLDLIINNEEKVKESQCIEIFNKIKQRYIGKPISKIFGKKEFKYEKSPYQKVVLKSILLLFIHKDIGI